MKNNKELGKSRTASTSDSQKGMSSKSSGNTVLQNGRIEDDPRSRMSKETSKGEVHTGSFGRTMGAATKDNRHGVHTDHSASRRSESRRDGSMGRESKSKENRKNV